MFKNILFIILVLLFLTACSDSNSMRFDYSDMDNTSGLTVEPANILQFQDKNRGDVLKFKLHFSSSELDFSFPSVDFADNRSQQSQGMNCEYEVK